MTNDELSPNGETRNGAEVTARFSAFVLRHFFRNSPFVLHHFSCFIRVHSCLLVVYYDIRRERNRGLVSQLDGNQG